jgi:hypothetical protein
MFTSWNDSAFEISRINLIEFCIFVTRLLYIIRFSEKIKFVRASSEVGVI